VYIRVSNGSFDPSKYDELVALTEDVAARMKNLPGFVSYYGGSDERTGALVAISIWQTEETANFSRDALGDIITRLNDINARLEPATIYRVHRAT
jgi:quinol monooxygenase YgiN